MTVGQALSGKEEIEQALDHHPATHNAETNPPGDQRKFAIGDNAHVAQGDYDGE